ncbi:Ig-like domain-containing protein [Ideonella sp. YS5]|uniref:Ig-like domain-containing protein n=1 Tax=Ideonella sp. YS5 TaxID=3453714 RepID=UPI003EE8CB9E
MKFDVRAARRAAREVVLCAAAALLATGASAHHIGESLAADQQLVAATDRFLSALQQYQKLPPPQKEAAIENLVQLAQARQRSMVALLQIDPTVAGTRMLPRPLRARVPAAAAAYVEDEVHVLGNSALHVSDNFANGASQRVLKVRGRLGEMPKTVYVADVSSSPRDLSNMAGKKMSFHAMRVGDNLVLLDKKKLRLSALSSDEEGALAAPIQGNQTTLSILVNFSDAALNCTASDLTNRLFGATGATVNNNYRESSQGLVSFSGRTAGPYTIAYASTGPCDYMGWASAAQAAAKAAGIDPAQYMHVNYVTPPNASCGWSGMASMPGTQSWVQACALTGVFSHELGHNLSLDHAATPGAEYGDGSDPMGGARVVDHNAANRVMAGWMPDGTVQDISAGGSYSLATISLNAPGSSPQVLRLAKPDTAELYYVSMRQAMNLDVGLSNYYVDNISIHRSTGTLPARTYLLQNLAVGQSFVDETNGITITNQGVAGGVATVNISKGGQTCNRVAPMVEVTPASQTAGPGSALSYSVTVTNQNSAACGNSVFNLAQTLPADFTGTFGVNALIVGAGARATTDWTVRSAATVPDATYTLTASATDSGSGLSAFAHASDIVYTDPAKTCVPGTPGIVVSPATQTCAPGGKLTYGVSVTNTNSTACGTGTFSLTQTLPAGFTGSFSPASLAIAPGAKADAAWTVSTLSDTPQGTYTITARTTDQASGVGSAVSATDVVYAADGTPPSVNITSPANGATVGRTNLAVSASATDTSGIQAVEFYADGVLLARDTTAPYSATWNTRKAGPGAHTLSARAYDKAGNTSQQTIGLTVK